MKNMFKYAYSLLVAAAALTAVSCSDKYEYDGKGQWDATGDYANIYFPVAEQSVELDPADPTSLTVTVGRRVEHEYTYGKDSEGNDSIIGDKILTSLPALTVPVQVVKNTDDIYTVGEAVFAEGDTLATLNVSFPNAEVGTPYELQLTLSDPALVSKWSEGILYTLNVTRVKWNDVGFYYDESGNKVEGYATYREDFLSTFWGVGNPEFPVPIQERDDMKGYFRLKNVYGADYPYNDPGDWDDSKDYYIYIDATNPDKVYIPHSCETGLDWGYGMVSMSSYAGYYIANDRASAAADYYGTYANGQITFPKGALLISMTGYRDGNWYGSNNAGQFRVLIDPDLDLYTASLDNEDFDWEKVFTGTYMSAQLGQNTPQITLYKGVKKDDIEAANPGCYDRFAAEYGTPYLIAGPYAEGYDIVFCVKDGEVVVPEGYESQALGFTGIGYDIYGTIGAGGSTFTDDQVDLKITFTDKSGKTELGTSVESLVNITYTKDMVLGAFTYYGVSANNGQTYNLGDFTIEEVAGSETDLVIKDLYLEGSEIPASVDLDAGKLYVQHLAYIGMEEDEGTDYAVYTYDASGNKLASFDINIDGSLTSDNFILVATPDGQSLYYWFNATQTTFVPASATAPKAFKAAKKQTLAGKKGSKLNVKLNSKLRK